MAGSEPNMDYRGDHGDDSSFFLVVALLLLVLCCLPRKSTKLRAEELAYRSTWQVMGVKPQVGFVEVGLYHRKMGETDNDAWRYETAYWSDPTYADWRREKAGDFIVVSPLDPKLEPAGALGGLKPVSVIHNDGPVLGL